MNQMPAPSNAAEDHAVANAEETSAQELLTALQREEDFVSPLEGAALGTRQVESMGFVLDVPVELTIELGRKAMRIGEILRLAQGSVLELDKVNGEPLDIYANNRLIARGDAVVIGERYGVRLTEVMVVDDKPRGGQK